MRDVTERPTVDQRRCGLERLDEVGLDRVLHEDGHRARGTELACRDERPVSLLGDDHALDARLEVLEIARQAEDGHDLRGHRDVEAALAGHPVSRAAQTDDEATQRAIVHVEHAFPEDPSHVEPERIALRQMIVQHRGQ